MIRELLVRSTECKPRTEIGQNLKSVIPAKQFNTQISCAKQNQQKKVDYLILGDHLMKKKAMKNTF